MTSDVLSKTASQIITNALRKSRIIPAEQQISANDFQTGLDALQEILKFWQAQELHLWKKTRAILFLNTGQRKYVLGPDGDDCAEDEFFNTTLNANQVATDTVLTLVDTSDMTGAPEILSSSPTQSTQDWTTINSGTLAIVGGALELTNGAAVSGGCEYTLDTTVGQEYLVEFTYVQGTSADADFSIVDGGSVVDTVNLAASGDGTLSFTATDVTAVFRFENGSAVAAETSSISNLNYKDKETGDRIGIELDDTTRFWSYVVTVDTATQATIKDGLPSAAATGLSVFNYSTKIARPMRVYDDGAQFAESLTSGEIPVNQWSRSEYFNQPDKDSSGTIVNIYYSPQLTNGDLYVWEVASNVNQLLRFDYEKPIKIPTVQEDSIDLPSEWYIPLQWAVAAEIGPIYGVPDNRQIILEQKAASTLNLVLGHDVERDSMQFQPNFTGA